MKPPAPGRRLPPDLRRSVILDVAGPLFARDGFEATRLQDVAAAAHVTKPILYRHFDSKSALYLALLHRHRDELHGFISRIPRDGSIAERMRAVLAVWLEYVEQHAYSWRLLFRDSGGGPAIDAARREASDRARAVLAEVIDQTAVSTVATAERDALAELMSAGMAGLVLWWSENPDVPRDAVVEAMVRTWAGVLDPPADLRDGAD